MTDAQREKPLIVLKWRCAPWFHRWNIYGYCVHCGAIERVETSRATLLLAALFVAATAAHAQPLPPTPCATNDPACVGEQAKPTDDEDLSLAAAEESIQVWTASSRSASPATSQQAGTAGAVGLASVDAARLTTMPRSTDNTSAIQSRTSFGGRAGTGEGQEATSGSGDADVAAAAASPASLTDWMRTHVAAVLWVPVRTSKAKGDEAPATTPITADTTKPADPGRRIGVAIRVTPDEWLPWAVGPFFNDKEAGPFAGYVLYRGKGGSAGLGVGYRWPMKDELDLTSRGSVVVGITLALSQGVAE